MSGLATPLISALQGVNHIRRNLYRRGILRSRRLPRPVISIGNLSMGGSGKTPATIMLSRMLAGVGVLPAILSRGYRRRSSQPWEVVRGDDVRRFGDEPVMLARALPGVPVIVGADRFAAGSAFLERDDCDAFLLDDGFQHIQLERDCNIVISGTGTTWNREGEGAMVDAHLLLRREHAIVPDEYSGPVFDVTLSAVHYRVGGMREPVSALEGRRVLVFSGLANNVQFQRSVASHGAVIVDAVGFPDHHVYSDDELQELRSRASGENAALVTTEKDWVKIRRDDIGVLEVEMTVDRPAELLEEILRRAGLGSEKE